MDIFALRFPWLMPLRRWSRLGIALLLAALLGGCASPITARVTRFNLWPADAAGNSFSFRAPAGASHELEQATYEGHVAAALERQGLKRAPAGQPGRIQAELLVSHHSEEQSWLQPVYQDHRVFVPPHRDAAGRLFPGFWAPDPFGPRYVGERQVSRTLHISSLQLRLLDTKDSPPGKPRTVFEARAMSQGTRDDLPAVVPYLVRAVFDQFPGHNGQVRTVKFDRESGALISP